MKVYIMLWGSLTAFLLEFMFLLSVSVVAQTVDYNLPENWLCHPVLKSTDVAREQNLSLTVRNPDRSIDTIIHFTRYADSLADIFYIYPTIDLDTAFSNTAMDKIDTATAKFVYRQQVGIYARFGRVFAPYYRQAKIRIFIDTSFNESTQLRRANCLEIAYNDIDSAFSHYLKYYNKGRKIILMGHSQGALQMRFLLRKKFDNNPALLSLLVVAISGGEPNYILSDGSRTGGSLQNIKTCSPRGSAPECGCVLNWRTWNTHKPVAILNRNSFFFNPHFVEKGLIYQTYDTVNHHHIESMYDFGYAVTPTVMPRYITLDSTMTNYQSYDGIFKAAISSDVVKPGSEYLLIDTVKVPNDKRRTGTFPGLVRFLQDTIPINQATSNYHVWDMQFVQDDLMQIIPQMISNCIHAGIPNETNPQNTALICPNPTSGKVHVNDSNQEIKSISIYDLQGALSKSFSPTIFRFRI